MALIDDAFRFSLTNLSSIDSYTLQILALIAFLPFKSLMRKLFLVTQWTWLPAYGALEQNWDSCLHTLEGHSFWVTSVVSSPDAKHPASASSDNTIRFGMQRWAIAYKFSKFSILRSMLAIIYSGRFPPTDRCWDSCNREQSFIAPTTQTTFRS